MTLRELQVEPGEAIGPAWARLKKWVAGLGVRVVGKYARINYRPSGLEVVIQEPDNTFIPHWCVRLDQSSQTVAVGFGTVNESIIPTLNNVPISGIDAAGNVVDIPPLDLGDVAPNSDLQSWVALQVGIDLTTGEIVPPGGDLAPAIITHVSQLNSRYHDGGTPNTNNLGICALAMILWDDPDTPASIQQIKELDIQHEFQAATPPGTRGRHFFY